MHCNWHNNNNQNNDDTQDDAQPHLHVLPPHVLTHTVGAPAEALGTDGKVIGFVFNRVQSFTTLGDFIDIVPHDTDSVVDLLEVSMGSPLAECVGFRALKRDIPPEWLQFSR